MRKTRVLFTNFTHHTSFIFRDKCFLSQKIPMLIPFLIPSLTSINNAAHEGLYHKHI